jgi:release factor glutamine methyltransferase
MAATVGQAIADMTARFAAAGIETARLDARVLVGHALNIEPSLLFARSDIEIAPETAALLETFAARRLAHEPVSRIVGKREFWGMDFAVTKDTLDPRADTETLVSAVLGVKDQYTAPRILDLGTGTGCILLAILKDWPEATGVGIDLNPGAVEAAQENAATLAHASRAKFQQGNWCAGLAGTFDIIVSNPPYIRAADVANLMDEVRRFDPLLALSGGGDGLAAYRDIIPGARAHLNPGGRLFLEIGAGQEADIAALLNAGGLHPMAEYRDLAGIVRCLEARI